jgi:hypothetical protein
MFYLAETWFAGNSAINQVIWQAWRCYCAGDIQMMVEISTWHIHYAVPPYIGTGHTASWQKKMKKRIHCGA